MKYYKELAALGVFTLEEAAEVMGSSINAPKNLNLMIKSGSIRRIKRNLYTCINLATGEDLADRFLIGSKVTEGAFLSFHSAFEYYGFYNQMFYEIQVASAQRFAPFEDNGYRYKCFATASDAQVEMVRGVKVATVERTIIDSINMLGKVMGAEELGFTWSVRRGSLKCSGFMIKTSCTGRQDMSCRFLKNHSIYRIHFLNSVKPSLIRKMSGSFQVWRLDHLNLFLSGVFMDIKI